MKMDGSAILTSPMPNDIWPIAYSPTVFIMSAKMHKIFMTRCDLRESRMVSAPDCNRCSRGSVVDNGSRVLCAGITKFFTVPCYFEMKSSSSVIECLRCPHGEVSQDRLRVFCDSV